jgi:hypothetical protein
MIETDRSFATISLIGNRRHSPVKPTGDTGCQIEAS